MYHQYQLHRARGLQLIQGLYPQHVWSSSPTVFQFWQKGIDFVVVWYGREGKQSVAVHMQLYTDVMQGTTMEHPVLFVSFLIEDIIPANLELSSMKFRNL
jgi:hypothetical protein